MPPDTPRSLSARALLHAWCLVLLLCAAAALFVPLSAHAAFPTVEATNFSESASASFNLSLPVGIQAGDLLIIHIGVDAFDGQTVNTPAGWTPFYAPATGGEHYAAGFYKTASGSEGGTVAVTLNGVDTVTVHSSIRISGWSGTPEVTTAVSGGGTTPDSPSETASWGSDDNLFVVFSSGTHVADDESFSFNAAPTNYSGFVNGALLVNSAAVLAYRQLASASDNPAAWGVTLDPEAGWLAATVSVRPARRSTLLKPPNNLGLVGYWSFNDGTGTIATDFSGNGYAAPFPGGGANPAWVNGRRGNALQFDGNSDYLETNSAISYSSSVATISFWLNWDAYANDCDPVIGSGDPEAVSGGYQIIPNDCDVGGVFSAMLGGGGANDLRVETIARPSAGAWHHYVFVLDNSTSNGDITVYLDGVATSTAVLLDGKTVSGNISTQKLDMMSYAGQAGGFFGAGKLDELRIYNRALSATEIAKLYGSGAVKVGASSVDLQRGSTLANGLVGHWTFDGADLTTTTATDRSSQGNDGTLSGGPLPTIGKLGQALKFDGTNDYVVKTSPTNFPTTGSYTVSTWFKPTTTFTGVATAKRLINTMGSPWPEGNINLLIGDAGSILACYFEDGVGGTGTESTQDTWIAGVWYHATCVHNAAAGTLTLYVNGAQVGQDTSIGTPVDTDGGDLYLGAGNSGASELANVTLDDVRIYNRALSPTEVQQLSKLGTVRITQ